MTDTRPAVFPGLTPRRGAYLVAAIAAASFGYDLMRMPIQVSDSLLEILDAQRSSSAWASFTGSLGTSAYLRPLRIAEIKLLFDLAQERHYWLVYRGFHVLLLAAAFLLFVRALDVRTWRDTAAATFALTVFTGLNTFRGTVREAFPINHFLIIVVLALVALNLARSKGGRWVDVAAVVVFVVASLTLESGLLVWVVVTAAWACGMRGISSRGVLAITGCLVAYFCARSLYLATGMPGLEERSSGFLLRVLEPQELIERFGANPIWFYAYNIATSMLSVPFSDPDGGVFEILRARLQGDVPPRLYIAVVSSTATTALIGWVIAGRYRRGTPRLQEADWQLLLIAGAVLTANAALSYAYTKHEILSVAGAFYAFAAFAAARYAIEYWYESPRRATGVAVVVLLALVSTMWTFRSLGVHHMLRVQAFRVRVEWARVSPDRVPRTGSEDERLAATALVRDLRQEALGMAVVNPYLLPRWADRWWGE